MTLEHADPAVAVHEEPFKRDLILRPTDLAPGIYEDEDGAVMVGGFNGKPHVLLWFDLGTGREHVEPGDTLFEAVYAKEMHVAAEGDPGVEVTQVKLEAERPDGGQAG